MRISDPSNVPNGWYTYTQQPAGRLTRPVDLQAHTPGLLYSRVRELRLANGIELEPEFPRFIEDDFCKRRPALCVDDAGFPLVHADLLRAVVAGIAVPMADALTRIGKALGVHCADCQIRNEIIHAIEKIGVVEAIRRVKATF